MSCGDDNHADDSCLLRQLQAERAEVARWKSLALLDPLTGLVSRAALEEHLVTEIARASRKDQLSDDRMLVVLYLDLDDFKAVNDRGGHAAGDVTLKSAARALRARVRAGDVVARVGGDEFVVVLSDISWSDSLQLSGRIRHSIRRETRLEVSVGTASYPRDGSTLVELLAAADAAMYRDKKRRKLSEGDTICGSEIGVRKRILRSLLEETRRAAQDTRRRRADEASSSLRGAWRDGLPSRHAAVSRNGLWVVRADKLKPTICKIERNDDGVMLVADCVSYRLASLQNLQHWPVDSDGDRVSYDDSTVSSDEVEPNS